MFAGLSLDQAPPFEAPLKFFLTAPIMAIIGSLMVLFGETNIIALHLVTIGFLIMMMFGAMQQMLPVVAGVVIKKSLFTANLTYGFLLIFLFSFSIGFYYYLAGFLQFSIIALLLSIAFFSIVSLKGLFEVQNRSLIVNGMIVSFGFFVMAFLLGLLMIYLHISENIGELYSQILSLHFNIIFFGWVFLLIATIAFQVIPMFWVCEAYTKNEQKIIIFGTTMSLLLLIADTSLHFGLYIIFKFFIALIGLFFSFITYTKLQKRKRKLRDQSVLFWQTGLLFFIFGLFAFITSEFIEFDQYITLIMFGGFAISIINGMAYKIIPFLTWFHLSSKGIFTVPNMRDMIVDKLITLQRYLHILAFATFLFDMQIGAFLFLLSNIFLFYNLLIPARIYFSLKVQ
ncbi:MAG: hypothetical protein L0Y61_01010 [Epsilonproteobacteria bacterium]|nr:hypothetical protein [Campylobacterota bacterium]